LTVKRDNANKTITFLDMLLAQTDEDQFNIGFQAESSTGKSYIPIELLEYFPDGEKRTYAGASPTSFYHEMGIYKPLTEVAHELDLSGLFDENELADPKRRVIVVDLRSKILVFLDQPHWQLLEKLRPLLSHDRRMLRYSITDKMGKGSLRAKTVIILGFSSVIFCTTKSTQEDQERTRLNLLSPESSQEKIRESLSLQAEKIGNRKAFRERLGSDPGRKWLKNRVQMIRTTGIRDIIIPDVESILERFKATRPHLAPRHQRDFPRLLFYVKGFALLNCFQRERVDHKTIRANYIDIENGFKLYLEIAKSNELGISPETYRIYEEVLLPLAKLNLDLGLPRIDIVKAYLQRYGRPLPWKRLTTDILPALESAGLIRQDKNPDDKRETLVWCPIPGHIVETENNTPHNTAPPTMVTYLTPPNPTLLGQDNKGAGA